MGLGKTRLAAGVLAAWLFIVAFFMVLSRTVNIEIFFVLWLIGTLIVIEFIDVSTLVPRWSIYQKGIAFAGVIIFGLIIIQKILEILAK